MDFLGSYNEIYLRNLTSPLRHCIEKTGRSNDVPSSISETWHLLEPVFLFQRMTSLCSWCLQSGWNFLFVLLIFFFFLSTFWMEFFEVRTMVQALSLPFSKAGLHKHSLISAAALNQTFGSAELLILKCKSPHWSWE